MLMTLGIRTEVERLSAERARQLIGDHYEGTSLYYSTPESPFDEAKLIRRARERAEKRGAVFCDLTRPVEIVSRKGRSPSHRLRVDGKEMEFAATVLAAGAGNIPLLESLKNQVRIGIEQTPLLVIPGPPTIEAPILVKRTKDGFSLVAHRSGPTRTSTAGDRVQVRSTGSRKEDSFGRLYAADEFSVALTHFRSEQWRKIRASRGFERIFSVDFGRSWKLLNNRRLPKFESAAYAVLATPEGVPPVASHEARDRCNVHRPIMLILSVG